jgi:hypothetical protein
MTDLMFYVASFPEHPDEAFAACVDEPQYQKDTAKTVSDWIKRGALVRRVSAVEGKTMMDRYVQR